MNKSQLEEWEAQLNEKEEKLLKIGQALAERAKAPTTAAVPDLDRIQKVLAAAKQKQTLTEQQLAQSNQKIKELEEVLAQQNQSASVQPANEEFINKAKKIAEIATRKTKEAVEELNKVRAQCETATEQLSQLSTENQQLKQEVKSLNDKLNSALSTRPTQTIAAAPVSEAPPPPFSSGGGGPPPPPPIGGPPPPPPLLNIGAPPAAAGRGMLLNSIAGFNKGGLKKTTPRPAATPAPSGGSGAASSSSSSSVGRGSPMGGGQSIAALAMAARGNLRQTGNLTRK